MPIPNETFLTLRFLVCGVGLVVLPEVIVWHSLKACYYEAASGRRDHFVPVAQVPGLTRLLVLGSGEALLLAF